MKKILLLIISTLICISLAACGSSEQSSKPRISRAVTNVEAQIDSIGEITFDKKEVIESALISYYELSDKEKAQVSNFDVLQNAEIAYIKLYSDLSAEIEYILSNYQGEDAYNKLKTLTPHPYVQTAIAEVCAKELETFVIKNGTTDEYGNIEYTYKGTNFELAKSRHQITIKRSIYSNSPREPMLSSFKMYGGSEYIMVDVEYAYAGFSYSRGDMYDYKDSYLFSYSVWWHTFFRITRGTPLVGKGYEVSITGNEKPDTPFFKYYFFYNLKTRESIDNQGMEVKTLQLAAPWPYIESEESLNERFKNTSDADSYISSLDSTFYGMGLWFSSWDLIGLASFDS